MIGPELFRINDITVVQLRDPARERKIARLRRRLAVAHVRDAQWEPVMHVGSAILACVFVLAIAWAMR